MKKRSIKTKLSSSIFAIVLLTVAVISFLANYFINQKFTEYIAQQQKLKVQVIESTLSEQYNLETKKWDLNFINAVGMYSLYEGYIVKVYDKNHQILWDAQAHDMNLCKKIIDDISERMRIKYPQLQGQFTSTVYPLEQSGNNVGYVSISYFGPFFLNDNEFNFLDSLNKILVTIGLISLILSIIVGRMLAKRISNPIMRTVETAKYIADGRYDVRLKEDADTKELNMLEGSINHLALSLETLEKLRKQLTQDVAHELRTPVTILQSYMEAMLEGVWEPTTDRLQSCYDEATRMGKLVNDLENLAKVESSNLKLNKSMVDLDELVRKTIHSFENEISNRQLEVTVEGPEVTVNADYDRISQVVVNLFSNAMKYSKQGGNITFELFQTPNSAGFHLKDDGIGIPENELPYIFERFYRADKSRNRSTGGSGIGLTIVKSIMEAHGGSVKVESKINEGSTFTVYFPVEE